MVPSDFHLYFQAIVGAAAGLIGLLFVAVSLRPDSVFGSKASARGEALAGSAFTGLVNAFFVSLVALMPNTDVGAVAVVMALLGLWHTVRERRGFSKNMLNVISLLLILAALLYQVDVGAVLIASPKAPGAVGTLAVLLLLSLAASLSRAWLLLQGRHLAKDTPDE
ncbi:MAG: hypothetical protein M0027_14035 [Candidatus Dormibacteraeota bacterium]|jgi:hypothetical protein|nr:hypothetical protein [Candidatus Dormibacteraeota bacterium]